MSNQHVNCLIQGYFANTIPLMFNNLKHLTLIDCSSEDLVFINPFIINLTQLEYLYITVQKLDPRESSSLFTNSLKDV